MKVLWSVVIFGNILLLAGGFWAATLAGSLWDWRVMAIFTLSGFGGMFIGIGLTNLSMLRRLERGRSYE